MNERPYLFSPLHIGKIRLRNRIVMPAMATNFPSPSGYVTQRHIDYYAERAKGGAGLILIEGAYVEPRGKRLMNQLFTGGEAHEKEMRKLVDEIHAHGAHVGLQITHGGRECSSKITGFQPVGPTSLPSEYRGITKEIEMPEELTEPEIVEIIGTFVRAAEFCRRAGFDLVEIHGAHGYLLSQFLSPAVNFRKDRYGKSIEGRARIVTELLDRMKAKLKDLPIIIRFNADDFIDGGMSLPEAKVLAHLFEKHGADALHVSGGFHASVPFYMISPMGLPENCLVHLAEGIKKEVSVPVITVGKIISPHGAEEILRTGKADLVAFGRALIADPELPLKSKEGREEEIRPCIGCNQGCIGAIHKQLPLTCLVNPAAGREREFSLSKVPSAKKVVIVGGGPAGLEAARISRLRGHQVVLFEKEKKLGGKLKIAGKPPSREAIGKVVDYYERSLSRLGADIRLGREAGEEDILSEKPDEVVLAVGGKPYRPEIPGMDHPHVVCAEDVLRGTVTVGEKCIVVGGGMVGLETAEFLLAQGKSVILLEMMETIASDMEPRTRSYLFFRLKDYPLDILVKEKVIEIVSDGVITTNGRWKKKIIGADHIVLATGVKPDEQSEGLRGLRLYRIGDCDKVGDALDAIHAGARLALGL